VRAHRTSSSAAHQLGRPKTGMVHFGHATEKVTGFPALPRDPTRHRAIIVIHEWWGLDEWVKEQAEKLAAKGYVALAVDLYKGKVATDPSEARKLKRGLLRQDRATRVAILPIGFCYPGAGKNGSDNPTPRPDCAPRWHQRLLKHLPDLKLTLLVGQHAHRYYLGAGRKTSMTETVKSFSQHGDQFFPLPHPSWRSGIWMQRNPWFEETVIPELRNAVRKLV
jgi:hypothetical protein